MSTPATHAAGQVVFGRLLLIGLAVWLHAADTLVTATMAPAVVEDLGGVNYINWLISLYEAGAVISGASIAAVSQRFGLKQAMLFSALAYFVGCLVAAMAGHTSSLLWGRLIQGLGGGALLSLSYVATYEWFDESWWNRVFGLVAAIWGAGSLLGPLIGGLFAHPSQWRTAFWIFAALSALLCSLILLLLPKKIRESQAQTSTAWPIATIGVLSMGTLLIAQAGVSGGSVSASALCVVGVLFLYASAQIDRRSAIRLLPLDALKLSTPLGAGLWMLFSIAVATTGFWTYGPMVLKQLFNIDPLISGYILAAEAIAWSLGTVAMSFRAIGSDTTRIRGGVLIVALGAAGFTLAVPSGSITWLTLCACAQGLGFGICWPVIVTRCVQLAGDEKTIASAAPSTMQRVGYSVGTAFAGVLANLNHLAARLHTAGAKDAVFWVFAGFVPMLLVGLWLTWGFTRNRD